MKENPRNSFGSQTINNLINDDPGGFQDNAGILYAISTFAEEVGKLFRRLRLAALRAIGRGKDVPDVPN
jgi:hypothetical protein